MLNRPLILRNLSNTIKVRLLRNLKNDKNRFKVLQRRGTRTIQVNKINGTTSSRNILGLLKLRRMRTFRNTNRRDISLTNIRHLNRNNIVIRNLRIVLSLLNMFMTLNTRRHTSNNILRINRTLNLNMLTILLSSGNLEVIMVTNKRVCNLLTFKDSTRLLSIRVPVLNTQYSNKVRHDTYPCRIKLLRTRLLNSNMDRNHLVSLTKF